MPDTQTADATRAAGTDAKAGTKAKGAKAENKKGKGKKGKGANGAAGGLSVASHPRAAQAVRRAKGFGGIAGFLLAALLAHRAGLSTSRTVERALVFGVAGYLLAWACAVTVWRQIIVAQLRALAARRPEATPAPRTLPPKGTPGQGPAAPAGAPE